MKRYSGVVDKIDYTKEEAAAVEKTKKCKNHYEVLGVKHDCTDEELRKSYKILALKCHPDKNLAPGAIEAFKNISIAFSVLSDPTSRRCYDESIEANLRRDDHHNTMPFQNEYKTDFSSPHGRSVAQAAEFENRWENNNVNIGFFNPFCRKFYNYEERKYWWLQVLDNKLKIFIFVLVIITVVIFMGVVITVMVLNSSFFGQRHKFMTEQDNLMQASINSRPIGHYVGRDLREKALYERARQEYWKNLQMSEGDSRAQHEAASDHSGRYT